MSSQATNEECKAIFAALSEYLDMDLPPEACQHLETHLAGCPPCIEFVESLRKSIGLCRNYSSTEFPAPLSDDARRELREAYQKMLLAKHSPS